MKNQRNASLRIRLAGMAMLGLFIILAATAYFSGLQVKRSSDLITTDAVPGTIAAHAMRMAMARSVGYAMVAASAQTPQSRDDSLKIAHDADAAFASSVRQYQTTIKINPAEDQALLDRVTGKFAEFQRQRKAYEALIMAGDREGSAAFLERTLVPAYTAASQPAEELLAYNHTNSITYANLIRDSVHRLYWAVAVVTALALVCAAVLLVNFAIRRREMEQLEMLKVSVDQHFDGAFWMDAGNRFVYVNDTACKILGYAREELLGQPVTMVAPYATSQSLGQVWQGLRATGFFTRESVHARKDGSQFPVELVASYVRFGDKEFNCSFTRDITERKRTEGALREKQAQLLFAMDIAKLAHWEFDVAKNLVTGDENIFQLMGTTSAQEGGLSMSPEDYIQKFVHPLDAALVAHEVTLGVATTDPNFARQFEHRLIRKDGTERVMMVRSRIVMDATGRTGKIHGTSQDITEQKRAQAELLWKTALLEAQVDSALDGILVVDEGARRILQNRRLFELFKVPDEIAGDADDAPLLQHVTRQTKDPRRFSERVAYLHAHRDEVGRDEVELQDGTILDRYSSPVRDKAGNYYGRIWAFRDITEQRKVEEQFRQAQKMEAIGTLAGGIAHDFNNILAAVIGYTEMAKRRVASDPVTDKYLHSVLQAGTRAVALVRQILAFSRQQEQQRMPIQLRHVVAEPLNLLRATIPSTIGFDVAFAGDLPAVLADPTQIHQIVMNLCTNAAHAMKDHPGRLGVQLDNFVVDAHLAAATPGLRPGPYVRLSISDTGHGMDAATKARIFEPFFTTKKLGEGTGLGLSVVHGIMQTHGGTITVYSQPGEGTVFHLYFPVTAAAAEETGVVATAIPAGHGERILFVDDEMPLMLLGQGMLTELGYVVEAKSNVLEALALIQADPAAFDLVITDLTMPGMLGTDLARQIHLVRPGLPVILTTGYTASLTEQRVREQGICELLLKPHTLQSLGLAVHRALTAQPKS